MMTKRKNPSQSQRDRLLAANANRCCVCKRRDVGLNLHHIDGDSSNTKDLNLAVLCVQDHDRHHRPLTNEPSVQHLELSAEEILRRKVSWEKFVGACQVPGSGIIATITMFGTEQLIHSAQVVYQWEDETIEHQQSFFLLNGGYDQWAEELLRETTSLGPNISIAMLEDPQPVEHCPCCGTGYSHVLKPALVSKLTDPRWKTRSVMSVYVNPENPSLAISLALERKQMYSATLHLCQGKYLHFECDYFDERVEIRSKPSVRTQVSRLVSKVISEWNPAYILIGTGNTEKPQIINALNLPKCWERRSR